jgi:hypothetical protein
LSTPKVPARRRSAPKRRTRSAVRLPTQSGGSANPILIFAGLLIAGLSFAWFHGQYTVSLQSPLSINLQWPLVIAERITSDAATGAQEDQNGHRLTAWQEYACRKFGSDCRVALAIQRAENPKGKCEIYHYNSDGTLDWGYFQINTVHLKRPGLNLRDLLDCKANIDFAYQLYRERGGFTPWSTYNSGLYRRFIQRQ